MADFPKEFSQQGGGNNISATFSEIASGLSFGRFYGLGTNGTSYTNVTRILTSNNVSTVEHAYDSLGYAITATLETSDFNLARTVKGDAFVTFALRNNGSTANKTPTVKIQVYDGSTATDISSTSSCTISVANNGYKQFTFTVPLTETLIKRGYTIRMVISTPSACHLIGNTSTYPHYADIPFKI